jgi:hypothetical protein
MRECKLCTDSGGISAAADAAAAAGDEGAAAGAEASAAGAEAAAAGAAEAATGGSIRGGKEGIAPDNKDIVWTEPITRE